MEAGGRSAASYFGLSPQPAFVVRRAHFRHVKTSRFKRRPSLGLGGYRMIRSSLQAVRVARTGSVVAIVLSLLLPAAAQAGPPSQIVEEHLVAQAGLSIGLSMNQVAHFFDVLNGGASNSCGVTVG